ncbi:Putative uncharacterized protein [Taphrina deformans PYCC 5710]|uniref:Pentatricopeptide repeat protein n=1 Tax=Taphrina deformans (strain PYCC 5710 / ATCC 11124 / CBS 356.35 / IMI 108563 / JCM 9778 / NBRC 8474) TaxID=1097556 RepID=R4XBA2_TAPDE|nr:Putative uncharacterized protein [Taphrina deformans PYCC 5710]|eukprot:CCG81631.1 Putative uncharacterized protein [Taphrina deformans PYCC 5710]
MTRSIRPHDIFRRPPNVNTHKLYRQRMNYIRKWFVTQRRTPPLSIWFLMLEEARIDKEQHAGSQLAVKTWLSMLEAKVEPDVHCYNSYIAATCVQPAMFDHAKLFRRRVTPEANKKLQYNKAKAKLTVQNAVKIYRQMLNQGVAPNSMTIELLILSLGWEANLDALKSLILQTWNISVPSPNFDALQDQSVIDEYEEEGIELEDQIRGSINIAKHAQDAALYPTQDTLLAISMAYGANSQCQLATKVVLSIAQVYDLTISNRVWAELMKWASIDSEQFKGFTPRTYVEQLLYLAKSTYGTRPSLSMYAIVASHVSAGDRNPSLSYQYIDKMLASIEGNLHLGRPKFQASKNYQHARQIATNIYRSISKRLDSSIRQLQGKRARASAGEDELRLLDEDIQRRKSHRLAVAAEWETRLNDFDRNMRNMIISQRSKVPRHLSDDLSIS